jgi:hypothetical protein
MWWKEASHLSKIGYYILPRIGNGFYVQKKRNQHFAGKYCFVWEFSLIIGRTYSNQISLIAICYIWCQFCHRAFFSSLTTAQMKTSFLDF